MCGHYTITDKDPDKLADRFDAILSTKESVEDRLGRYNVAPTQRVPAVVTNEEGERELRLLRWGLVPKWAKDLKTGYKMIKRQGRDEHRKEDLRPADRKAAPPGASDRGWLLRVVEARGPQAAKATHALHGRRR